MINRHFIVKVYLLALVCFLPMGIAYTFYKKNFGKQTVYVKDFPRIEMRNHLGDCKTIDDYKGNTLLVNFWLSTCPYCLDEMKYFPELLERYQDLSIMSISIDSASVLENVLENKPEPWTFIDTDNPQWTFYNVDMKEKGGYADILKVKSVPTYFLIDKQGRIISSPENAIFSIERELSGIFSLRAAYRNYIGEYGIRDVLKAAVVFHVMVAIIFLLLWLVRKYGKQYFGNKPEFSVEKDEASERDSAS